MRKLFRKIAIFLSVAAICAAIFLIIKDQFTKIFLNPAFIRSWIISFGHYSFLVFILLQVFQVVIFFIPGEVIQVAGGYVFGSIFGLLLSITGIMCGSILTFWAARVFGDKFLKRILPSKDYKKIKALIDRPKNKLILFILYLFPGFPKDVLGYVAGITPIRLTEFITLSTIARLPGIIVSTYMGSNLFHKNYDMVLVVTGIVIVLLGIGFYFKDKIENYFK